MQECGLTALSCEWLMTQHDRLREVGELMGVRVLDHVIIGKGRFVSFVDDGYW